MKNRTLSLKQWIEIYEILQEYLQKEIDKNCEFNKLNDIENAENCLLYSKIIKNIMKVVDNNIEFLNEEMEKN